jgi:hypothetical protein
MASTAELMKYSKPKAPEHPQRSAPSDKTEQLIIENLQKVVERSNDGDKHGQLVKAAYIAGGYVAGGMISESKAVQTLKTAIRDKSNVADLDAAFKAIQDGIKAGKKEPIKKLKDLKQRKNGNSAPKAEQPDPAKSLSDYDHLRITDKSDIPPPKPIMFISGETIAVNGDIFLISGAVKSGKSGFLSMAISAALYPDGVCPDAIEGMKMKPNTENHAILHFDTEQAAHKHKQNLMNILRRSKLESCPDHLLSYNIRKLPINSFATTTEAICDLAVKKFGGIHSIWIDGGADYVADVNDQLTSNQMVKYFEDLSIRYDTGVFLVVHTNPGSDKERGHFGSQGQRKTGGILSVKQEGDVSFVEAKILRYAGKGDIQKLAFVYDKEKGYHVGSGVHVQPDTGEKNREKKIKEAEAICEKIFSGQRSYKYQDAIDKIAEITFKSIIPNKTFFTVMNTTGMIEKDEAGYWRKK